MPGPATQCPSSRALPWARVGICFGWPLWAPLPMCPMHSRSTSHLPPPASARPPAHPPAHLAHRSKKHLEALAELRAMLEEEEAAALGLGPQGAAAAGGKPPLAADGDAAAGRGGGGGSKKKKKKAKQRCAAAVHAAGAVEGREAKGGLLLCRLPANDCEHAYIVTHART